ncbi:MAG: DUF4340 domain-containing protein [Desulfobulbaceae bacterium]|nr:DUF4340 domain-containing protein [Desulfobulbaceae bacterium]
MNKTKNIALVALLALQIALIAFLYRPGQNTVPAAANLFKTLSPSQLTSLLITDEQGKSVSLLKKDGWQIGEEGFPADQDKIDALIKKLADMKSSRLVSQNKSSHARLKVADRDFTRKIELGQGDSKTTFFLGTSPSAKSIHLRLNEANEVYQVNDLAAWEVQADKESWWQTKYLTQKSNLTELSISNAHGTLDLVNDSAKKTWHLKGSPEATLDSKKVESMLSSLVNISIDSYMTKDFAPTDKPVATITYRSKDNENTLQIWDKSSAKPLPEKGQAPGDDNLIIKASGSAFYAKAKAYVVKSAMDASIENLSLKPTEGTQATEQGALPALPLPDHK